MIESHLNYLIKIKDNDPDYIGNNSLKWGVYVMGCDKKLNISLDKRFNRYELFEYCADKNNSNLDVIIAILSWGGMNRRHGKLLFKNLKQLNELVINLRGNIYHARIEAYNSFQDARKKGVLPGLGIGYFTKLICFLAPSLNGYIMDQWASKSINLLVGKEVVKITSGGWVSDERGMNNPCVYEDFCNYIDLLGKKLECTGFDAEKRIFSIGRSNGKWRNYLIEHYKKI